MHSKFFNLLKNLSNLYKLRSESLFVRKSRLLKLYIYIYSVLTEALKRWGVLYIIFFNKLLWGIAGNYSVCECASSEARSVNLH